MTALEEGLGCFADALIGAFGAKAGAPPCSPSTERRSGFPTSSSHSEPASSSLGDRAVGLGDQLHQMAVGIVEIDAAAAIEVVDLAQPLAAEVRVVLDAVGADAGE